MTGKIIKGIGGFYYIHAENKERYACRAVGIFRKLGLKPLVGDDVEFEITDPKDMEGSLTKLLPRRNVLIRPAVANVDQAMIVFAVREPDPNLNLLDRFLIHMGQQDISVVIYFNKADLDQDGAMEKYRRIYETAGYRVLCGTTSMEESIRGIRQVLKGKTTVLAGPSGVGKSSLTNQLLEKSSMEVGELSRKIRRGKQTTRHTELFSLKKSDDRESYEGSFVLDTPGFTSLFLKDLPSGELADYYPEFADYTAGCRFTGCSHVREGRELCGVRRAAADGRIAGERYENYCLLYEECRAAESSYR